MQPSIQACLCVPYSVICRCPASLTHLSHMCWPSVQCVCRRFSEMSCFCLWFPGQKNGRCIHRHSHHTDGAWPHTWPGVPGAEPSPQSLADFSCVSACSLWGFLLSFLVILSVLALISTWLTFQRPRQTGEVITLCNCNHVKVLWANPLTYSIIPSLRWFAPPWAGRPELPVHHTHLSGEMRQRKQGQWVSMLFTSCRALKPVITQIT